MANKWTKEQQSVIDARGSNLLVSAAAGSGKTAVLVERIIGRILSEEDPVDIDRLLVVTFTKAAAAEMRERVMAAIEARCEADPENERLARQQVLIHNAQITTIDSFCSFVVRNHFGDIGIEPNFRVADEGELHLLEQDVLDEVFEQCYAETTDRTEENSPADMTGTREATESNNKSKLGFAAGSRFLQLVNAYSGSRNDSAVKEMVSRIYHMSASSPWPKEWIAGLAGNYQANSAEEYAKTDMIREIAEYTTVLLREAREELQSLYERASATEGLENYAKTLTADMAALDTLLRKDTENDSIIIPPQLEAARMNTAYSFEELYDFFRNFKLGSMSPVRKFQGDVQMKEAIKDERNRIKKELEDIKKNSFSMSIEELYEQAQRIRPMAEELSELSLRYYDAMMQQKREAHIADFSDVAHFALNILVDEETKLPRPAAEEFQQQYEEIMIDEYQDSNQVQEEILRAISRESRGEHNLFMVGDVKQSIYRFRLARPELFMEKYHTYQPVEDAANRRITLARNFRSRSTVLDFTNDIFYKIMQEDLGSVAYDADAALYPGASYPEVAGMGVEVLLYDTADTDEADITADIGTTAMKAANAENQETVAKAANADSRTSAMNASANQDNWTAAKDVTANADTRRATINASANQKEDAEDDTSSRIEARMIAQRIRRLMAEGQVTDKSTGELRPVRYGDIVILMRGVKSRAADFSEILGDAGIPVYVESSTGYFSAAEVQTVLSFLQILDNPLQDIPLAAVLHSPIAGLSDEEIVQLAIRPIAEVPMALTVDLVDEGIEQLHVESNGSLSTEKQQDDSEDKNQNRSAGAGSVSFSERVWAALAQAKDGKQKRFYDFYQKMRGLVQDLPIHELIRRILQESGYADYARALPAGAQRAANLDMLVEKAAAYEKGSYKGLFHFVRYIEQLHKYDVDFGEAEPGTQQENAVSIMTIHKSKGLEFPIVFLAGTTRRMNRSDEKEKLVLHADLGMGLDEMLQSPKRRRKSLIRSEIAARIGRESLGEELRVLYVALTRAKEKLILTGTMKDYDKLVQKQTTNVRPDRPLSLSQRTRAASYMDWILPALLSYPDRYEVEVLGAKDLEVLETVSHVQENLALAELYDRIEEADPDAVDQIAQEMEFTYPYAQEASRKSKYSVSELKRNSLLELYDRQQNEAEIPDFIKEEKEPFVPQFAKRMMQERMIDDTQGEANAQISDHTRTLTDADAKQVGQSEIASGVQRGTAVHRVMQCLDFQKILQVDGFKGNKGNGADGSGKNIRDLQTKRNRIDSIAKDELTRMQKNGLLSPDMAALVSTSMLAAFLSDPVALRMARADACGSLFREKPFVMEQDGVLIQGIIDVFWLEEGRLVLLDYKTDAVQTAQELIDRYCRQLELYADALGRLFPAADGSARQVECLLYSFRLRECICL